LAQKNASTGVTAIDLLMPSAPRHLQIGHPFSFHRTRRNLRILCLPMNKIWRHGVQSMTTDWMGD